MIALNVLATACGNQMETEVARLVGVDRINDEITLVLFQPDAADVRLNSPIRLLIRNQSQQVVSLPANFGNRIYAYVGSAEEWQLIENLTNYVPSDREVILRPRGELLDDEAGLTVLPVAKNASEYSKLLIVVVGELDSNEQVAAYLELDLGQ